MSDPLIDSTRWRSSVTLKGKEGEPIVMIDDFFADPSAVIDEAAAATFKPMAQYYPGIRAAAASTTRRAVIEALMPVFVTHFGIRETVEVQALVYSLVTTPAHQLTPIQRLPHFDGTESGRLALIVYLCPTSHGGTSFYRHRSTGFESVSTERYERFDRALSADVERVGLPDPAYIRGNDALFERIDGSPAVPNRALIYRGRNLHSADILDTTPLSSDPRVGRLTLNGFLLGR